MLNALNILSDAPAQAIMAHYLSTANVANHHYHKGPQDVAVMAQLGLNSYRFSIAWPRIFPDGDASKPPNAKGVAFYRNLIGIAAHTAPASLPPRSAVLSSLPATPCASHHGITECSMARSFR